MTKNPSEEQPDIQTTEVSASREQQDTAAAAPGCELADDTVAWRYDGEKTEAFGAGVFRYNADTYAIPVSCPATGTNANFTIRSGSRYESGAIAHFGELPTLYKTAADTGRVLPGSLWDVEICHRPELE